MKTHKKCGRCQLTKSVDEFGKNCARYDGLQSQCRPCYREASRDGYHFRGGKERAAAYYTEVSKNRDAESKAARQRVRWRRYRYGPHVPSLLDAQQNLCAICETDFSTLPQKHRHVDHCHKTGLVRGWLCHGCNLGIGNLKDDPKLLRKAAEYLQRFDIFK